MSIWKRATVDLPPTEKSLVAKYVNREVHICNGKTIGPPHGYMPVGWAAQMDKYPIRQIAYPPLSGKNLKFGSITSMTITRGVHSIPFEQVDWNHCVRDMQHLMRMPNSLNMSYPQVCADYRESDNDLLRSLFDEWLECIYSDPLSVSVRSVVNRVPEDLNIEFTDPVRELTVEFKAMQPFCTPGSALARKMLEDGLEEKLAHGDTATVTTKH